METKQLTSIEIDGMDKNKLLTEYLKLQKATDRIKLDMTLVKDRLLELLEEDDENKFINPFGEATIMQHSRNQFLINKAKTILSKEQIAECTEEKEMKFLKIMSAEAKESSGF